MEELPPSEKKTFKPLIIFDSSIKPCDNNNSTTATESRNEQALIEQHLLKTKTMLDHNAQLWEKEGRPYETTQSSSHQSNSSDQQSEQPLFLTTIDSSDHHDDGKQHNSTLLESHTLSFGVINTEPQTQRTIPIPLSSQRVLTIQENSITAATSPAIPNQDHNRRTSIPPFNIFKMNEETEEEIEYFDTEEEVSISNSAAATGTTSSSSYIFGTTFINEPQFHHTYRPYISRKRRRGNLPKEVTEYLKQWLLLHKKHPYPTEREKQKLADETGLMVNQISNWFINARRRILQPLMESENRDQHQSAEATSSDQASSSSQQQQRGVNVVGGDATHNRPRNSSITAESQDQYHLHHHHNCTASSSTSTSELLLQELSQDNLRQNTEEGKEYHAPPPWVLLPAKLPSMNILEKDLDAFESDDERNKQ